MNISLRVIGSSQFTMILSLLVYSYIVIRGYIELERHEFYATNKKDFYLSKMIYPSIMLSSLFAYLLFSLPLLIAANEVNNYRTIIIVFSVTLFLTMISMVVDWHYIKGLLKSERYDVFLSNILFVSAFIPLMYSDIFSIIVFMTISHDPTTSFSKFVISYQIFIIMLGHGLGIKSLIKLPFKLFSLDEKDLVIFAKYGFISAPLTFILTFFYDLFFVIGKFLKK